MRRRPELGHRRRGVPRGQHVGDRRLHHTISRGMASPSAQRSARTRRRSAARRRTRRHADPRLRRRCERHPHRVAVRGELGDRGLPSVDAVGDRLQRRRTVIELEHLDHDPPAARDHGEGSRPQPVPTARAVQEDGAGAALPGVWQQGPDGGAGRGGQVVGEVAVPGRPAGWGRAGARPVRALGAEGASRPVGER